MSEWLLPLFPLKVVLFPHTDLPLHIFEERYKQMIGECVETNTEFGVVLVREQSVETTGCAAAIAEVVKRYEDGRMDIRVRGGRRFSILMLNQEKPYLRGEPRFFDDDHALSLGDPRRGEAMELYERIRDILGIDKSEEKSEDKGNIDVGEINPDDEQLSFQIMGRLPLDLDFKQSLLPLTSEEERLQRVITYLEQVIAQVSLTVQARARASGNGRSH